MAVLTGLERYRYISTLGAGGMATVSLAEDGLLGRKVALKRLARSGPGDFGSLLDDKDRARQGSTRLRREALLGASVSHPNIVSIYDVVTADDGDLVIVMEYVPGETLGDRLVRAGRMSPAEALPVLGGIAAGLDAIHELGIVHRDVKPANVLLGPEGTVKLADLGIATVPGHTRITSAGAVLGTFRYMAPEQLDDGPSAPGTDIYALAAVAFEMLSGQKARPESSPMALAHAIATQPPPDLRAAWPEAPPAVATLLSRAMSRDPAQRPRRAGELVGRMRAALQPEPTRRIPAMPSRRVPAPDRPSAKPAQGMKAASPVAFSPGATLDRRQPSRGRGGPAVERNGPAGPAAGPSTDHRRKLGPALLALVALAAAAIVVVTLIISGSSSRSGTRGAGARSSATAASHRSTRAGANHARTGAGNRSSTGASTSGAPAAGSAASSTSSSGPAGASASSSKALAGSPVAAVESFYHLSAAHSYPQAWALADPTFRNQLGGYASFERGQADDRSITFDSARVLSESPSSATVAVRTTSVRDNGTQHCVGTADLRSAASTGTWLLHLIHINCS